MVDQVNLKIGNPDELPIFNGKLFQFSEMRSKLLSSMCSDGISCFFTVTYNFNLIKNPSAC